MELRTNGHAAVQSPALNIEEAASVLTKLAGIFFERPPAAEDQARRTLNYEARYKALLDQIPAVVFMAYFDEGIGEAYVSPQIEAALGFSQQEWLEDPVRWYQQIHPADKERWSLEAASMFLSGEPLRSSYRVIARNGAVVWFHCEAHLVRRDDGTPWFIHGLGFDITEFKTTEQALQVERNMVSAILDTVGALVVVLDESGIIVRFNRACEQTTGYTFEEVQGKRVREMFLAPEDTEGFGAILAQLQRGVLPGEYESHWLTKDGDRRLISLVQHGFDRERRRRHTHHRDRDRYNRAEAFGKSGARNWRAGAAANRTESARRARPAFDRNRVHE